jgi:hypothetical protein
MRKLIALTLLAACGDVKEAPDVLSCGDVEGELACNTFEADDPAWTTLTMGGVAVIDESDSISGNKSLRATVAAGGGKAVRTRAVTSSERYYARFHAKIPDGGNLDGLSLLHLGEPTEPFLGTNVEVAGGMLGAAVQSGDVYVYPAPMPVGRWVCLELELVVSDTGGRVIVRLDGTTVVDRDAIDTRPAAAIGDLEVGLSYVAPATASDTTVLIDDVVVATQPLAGCTPPGE